jgi:N utilization substance protein B
MTRQGAQGRRRTAREMAVRMLFQIDLGGARPEQVFQSFDSTEFLAEGAQGRSKEAAERRREMVQSAFESAKRLVVGTLERRDEIDALIREQADNWRIERMPAVDRNILRLAIHEFQDETDVPKLVVMDEAIELAKRYGSEHSGRFVNGLLDGLLKKHRFPGVLK